MRQQWIKLFRKTLQMSGLNASEFSDDEILECAKGVMLPMLVKSLEDRGIPMKHRWQYEMYFDSLVLFFPPPEGIEESVDMDIFKNRAKNSKN